MAQILSRLAVEVNEKPLCPFAPVPVCRPVPLASESALSVPDGHLRSTAGEGFRATLTRIADLVPAWGVGKTDASLSGGMAEAAVATQAFADSHRNL
jgi:hypothetical protein